MESSFCISAVPEPVTCCGLPLKPFALGHYILLARFENAYLGLSNLELGDLLLGSFICSFSFNDAKDALADPGLNKFLERWGRKITTRKLFQPVTWDFSRASKLFVDYIDNACSTIHLPAQYSEHQGTSLDTPWVAQQLSYAISRLNLGLDEALNMPLGLLRWLIAVDREREGNGSIVLKDRNEIAKRQKDADLFAATFHNS